MKPVWLAAAVLVLVPASTAGAAPLTAIDTGAATRSALAGDRVLLWDGERPVLSVREPDGSVRALHRARRFSGTSSVFAEVAATGSQVAFVTEGYDAVGEGGLRWSSLRAGPLGGPYGLIAGKEGAGSESAPHHVAIAEAGILFSDGRGVALRPADGGPVERLGGTGRERIAVNGRYAATRTSTHAAVYDLQTRTALAALPAESDPRSDVPPSAGVSADGTLVYIDAAHDMWAFVPSTRQQTPLMPSAHEIVRVAGSTVYARTRSSGSHFEALQRLWAVDLAGGGPRPVTESAFGGEFVTDGARVLYRRGGCTFYGDLPATAPERAPVTGDCPRQPLSFFVDERQRRPAVKMRVTCPGAGGDRCTGTAQLTARRASGRGRVVLGTWRFDAAGGEVVSHTLKLRLGRRRQIARLRVTGSPYGRVDRRIVFAVRRDG